MAKNDPTPPAKGKAPEATPPASKGKAVPGIWVVAKRDGFRRCNIAWPKAGIGVALSALKKADLAALRAEPMLDVTDIEIPAADANE